MKRSLEISRLETESIFYAIIRQELRNQAKETLLEREKVYNISIVRQTYGYY